MHSQPRSRYLPAEEIAKLLAQKGLRLTPAMVADLQEFIDEISGIDNADAAVEMPGQLEAAA
jgi:hypothetical protein